VTDSADLDGAPLVRAECDAESPPDAAGWRGYLDDDDAALVFCVRNAQRASSTPTGRRSEATRRTAWSSSPR
jgi:hypothetical protein